MSTADFGRVGIADISNQIHYSCRKERVSLNIALLGDAESGKTSLINRALLAKVFGKEDCVEVEDSEGTTGTLVKIRIREQEFVEDGVHAHFRLIDVPMLGHTISKQAGNQALLHYLVDGQTAYLDAQTGLERMNKRATDPRVHLCVYFVAPHGLAYGLSRFEMSLLREVSRMSNLIICLSKADTLLPHEQALFKQKIINNCRDAGIQLFKQEDEEDIWMVSGISSDSSDQMTTIQNRSYPWGAYCHVAGQKDNKGNLEDVLIRKYLPDLLDSTNDLFARFCNGGVNVEESQ